MASESDSLRASSTTGETFTPLTTSSSSDSGAAAAAGYHRVGMVRQSTAASVPVQPCINISIDVPNRRPLGGTTVRPSQSPKRPAEEFKPTTAKDENGFIIYYDGE